MARDLLSKWLELPPQPWPPDHYALLGLEPGAGTSDEVELRVLERMEGLRHYQLMHPDAVTEGMNLLAQAMINLTDPSARRQYDRQLGVESNQAGPQAEIEEEEEPDEYEEQEEEEVVADAPAIEPPPLPPKSVRTVTYSKALPPPLPPLPSPETAEEPLPEPIQILELDDEPEPRDEDEEDEDEQPSLAVPRAIFEEDDKQDADVARDKRRRIYREIVRVRRVLRIWEQLQRFMDNAAKTFTRRIETVAFMNALADLRPLLGTVSDLIGEPNEPGNLIAALAKQQLVVEMFRSFLPSQREALATDCRSAHAVLTDHYRELRRDARQLTAKGFKRRIAYPIYRHLSARPEWLFLLLGIAALAIAFVRSVPK